MYKYNFSLWKWSYCGFVNPTLRQRSTHPAESFSSVAVSLLVFVMRIEKVTYKSNNKVWTEGRVVWLNPLRRRGGWSEQFWRFWREEVNFLKNLCWKITFDLSPPVGALGYCSRLVPVLASSCQLCGMWDADSFRGSSRAAASPSHCCSELLRLLLSSVSEVLTFTGF